MMELANKSTNIKNTRMEANRKEIEEMQTFLDEKRKKIEHYQKQYSDFFDEKYGDISNIPEHEKLAAYLMFFIDLVPEEFTNIDNNIDVQARAILLFKCIDDIIRGVLDRGEYQLFKKIENIMKENNYDVFKRKREKKNIKYIEYEIKKFKNMFEVKFKKDIKN